MPKSHNQKTKILILEQLLCETDEQSTVSMQEILDVLAGYGICAERKSIYDDMNALRDFGYKITYKRGRKGGYYVTSIPEYRKIRKEANDLMEDPAASTEQAASKKETQASDKKDGESQKECAGSPAEKSPQNTSGMCREEICEGEKRMKLAYPPQRAEEVMAYFGEAGAYKQKKQGQWTAAVPRLMGPQFYGWLVSMNGDVHILKPKKIAAQYQEFLKKLIKEYRKL